MIKKYMTKPAQVEAVQYDGSNVNEVQDFCRDVIVVDGVLKVGPRLNVLPYDVSIGSYVVKHDDGTFDVIQKHRFEKMYMELDGRHYAVAGSFY